MTTHVPRYFELAGKLTYLWWATCEALKASRIGLRTLGDREHSVLFDIHAWTSSMAGDFLAVEDNDYKKIITRLEACVNVTKDVTMTVDIVEPIKQVRLDLMDLQVALNTEQEKAK
jgi:hypothetical protein